MCDLITCTCISRAAPFEAVLGDILVGSSRGVAICGVVRACTLQGREHCAGGECAGRTWRERHTEGLRACWPRASDRSRVKQRIHLTTAHFTYPGCAYAGGGNLPPGHPNSTRARATSPIPPEHKGRRGHPGPHGGLCARPPGVCRSGQTPEAPRPPPSQLGWRGRARQPPIPTTGGGPATR